jgi:two-component system phosphate regulon sensor histidine kinase PhoR
VAKKTLYKIFAFGVSVITITAVLILSVFYSYSDNQLKEQLRVVESVVENQLAQDDDTAFISNHIDKNVRITLVAKDGAVVADSQESANKLGNHLNRQEIQQAIKNGEATVTRHSDTQEKKVYYFAKQLDNGNILRVSTEAKSIGKFFSDYIIYIILCIIVVIVAAVFVSMGITKSIVKPITQLGQSLDNIDKFKSDEELKPLVNALLQQKKKQKMLDKQKKQFTANVSHELKTPLTSIAGYAELIETGMAKPEDIKPFAGVIRKQALRLVNLSEDIIQLSQLEESDDEDMSFESVNLYEIAQRCVEALNINAINKCVTLNLTGEECYIRGKAQLVEELVYNLCDNAIRYNKENGNVTVTVTSLEKGASVSVKDTGIGIPKKYQERIFERFFRVDKSRSKATGGTGLGLAIVKHITQLHDAKLEISSEEGKGTEIIVTFKD